MNAEKITRQSKSNLALAFVALGRERRRDITTFYAFCRVIDDIADDPQIPLEEKTRQLSQWRASLRSNQPNESSLAGEIRALMAKYRITPEMLEEIIAGVEMDLTISQYATFEELRFTVTASPAPSALLASKFSAIEMPTAANTPFSSVLPCK